MTQTARKFSPKDKIIAFSSILNILKWLLLYEDNTWNNFCHVLPLVIFFLFFIFQNQSAAGDVIQQIKKESLIHVHVTCNIKPWPKSIQYEHMFHKNGHKNLLLHFHNCMV